MNLKKFFVTAAAVLVAGAAFAGNSSDTKVLIEQFFAGTDSLSVAELDDEQQRQINTFKALKEGLLAYEANLTADSMTDTDRAIHNALNTDIPTVLNKIQTSSDDVYDELYPLLQTLSDNIFANQSTYTEGQIDLEETAPVVMWMFSYVKAEVDGVLLGRASRVLQEEMAQMMRSVMGLE